VDSDQGSVNSNQWPPLASPSDDTDPEVAVFYLRRPRTVHNVTPVNPGDAGPSWSLIALGLWALLITCLQLIVLRHAGRVDKLSEKIDSVENAMGNMVTREELDKKLEKMAIERREMHEDNKRVFGEAMRQFQDNAAVERTERHAMRDVVGLLTTKVAVLADRIERAYKDTR